MLPFSSGAPPRTVVALTDTARRPHATTAAPICFFTFPSPDLPLSIWRQMVHATTRCLGDATVASGSRPARLGLSEFCLLVVRDQSVTATVIAPGEGPTARVRPDPCSVGEPR